MLPGMVQCRGRAALVILCALAAPAGLADARPATASNGYAARATRCGAKQVKVGYHPKHGRVGTWCLPRLTLSSRPAQVAVTIDRLLASGKLTPKRLARLVPRLPAAKERALQRAREGQLRRTEPPLKAAHAAGSVDAPTHTEGPIPPPPGQVGIGYFSESTSGSTSQDAEHATVHTTQTSRSRHEVFGPMCPDSAGNVVTRIKITYASQRSVERRGRRTTSVTEARITGTLSGGFTDAFDLRGPLKLELETVVETRVSTVIALTGKQVSREPTSTRRVSMSTSIAPANLESHATPMDTFISMSITGTAGPKGQLSSDDIGGDRSLFMSMLGLVYLARTEGPAAFAATVDGAAGFKCVVAGAQPDKLSLKNGASGSFTVTVRGLDDQQPLPSAATSRVYSGNLTLAPVGKDIPGPATGTAFQATSGGGPSTAEVVMASRRGYAPTLRIPISEPQHFPNRFTGTWTRVFTDPLVRLGWKETVQGTVIFDRIPLVADPGEGLIAVPYQFVSGSATWTVSGSSQEGSCTTTYSGTGTYPVASQNAIVDTGFTLEDISTKTTTSTPFYYSIRASGDPLTPPLFTITTSGGAGCASSSQEGIVTTFLDVGINGDFKADAPQAGAEKSADMTLLAGHRTRADPGQLATDDTWNFNGSY